MSAAREVHARPVVVVACTHADTAALTQVIRGLIARKFRVDLVPLRDANVGPLESALEQFGSGATYVVCHSAAMDRYTGELCELTVRAAEVPESQLVAAWFDATDPDALVETVCNRTRERLSGDALRTASPPTQTPSAASARAAPRVVVHASESAANEQFETDWDAPSSTRVAMKMALGWRRALNLKTYAAVFALAIALGLYFGGYAAMLNAAS